MIRKANTAMIGHWSWDETTVRDCV